MNAMSDASKHQDAEIARARSAAYGFIAAAFRYPDRATVDALTDEARWRSWPDAIRAMDADTGERLDAVRRCVSRVSAGAHVRLFGHAVRGTCPPYELEYGRSEIIQQASELADIAGFYSAFGLELTDHGNERADHLAVECEFMSALAAKEAWAIENGDHDGRKIVGDAQRSFLADHLGNWLPSFVRRVQDAPTSGTGPVPDFYGALAAFTGAFVAAECGRLDVSCGSQYLELRPTDPVADTTISCGASEACSDDPPDSMVQIGGQVSPPTAG